MSTSPKFCKDCLYCYFPEGGTFPRCARADLITNLVTGEQTKPFCETVRFGFQCGADAKMFQVKESAS